jgi:hypothetical protein
MPPSMSPSVDALLERMQRDFYEIEGQTFGQLATTLQGLVKDLRPYDRLSCLTAIAALSMVAENRNRIERLDCLLHLVAIHSRGERKVTTKALDDWLNHDLRRSLLAQREDPAEDVAVGNIMTPSGNRRIFTGNWSNPDSYAQDVLDALAGAPDSVNSLKAECDSALKISDLLATRMGYPRLTGKPETELFPVWLPPSDEELWTFSRQAIVHSDELAGLEIESDSVKPFCCTLEEFCAQASKTIVGATRRKPFITCEDGLIVVNPTAIAMAVVSYVFAALRDRGLLSGLEKSLGRVQGKRTLQQCADGVARSDFLTSLLRGEQLPPPRYVSQTAFRFDKNKYLHLLFLHDDVQEIAVSGPSSNWHPPFRDSFGDFIRATSNKFLVEGGCVGGLTLIVMGGVWRGCAIAMPRTLPRGCGIQFWSSADIDRLMANQRRWKLLLWKLSLQRTLLAELGISVDTSSDANLYAMWTHHDYRLIPRDDDTDSVTDVGYGPEFIFQMRQEDRSGIDDHCVYRPDRRSWERVRKLNSRSHFKEDSERKTYGALFRVTPDVLEGVVETMRRAWWVDCTSAVSDLARRHMIYNVWETAVNWIDRVGPELDNFVPELGSQNVILNLDVSEIVSHEDWTADGMKGVQTVDSMPFDVSGQIVSIRLPIAFVAMGYSPKNDAERLLVKTLVDGVLALARVPDRETRSAEIHRALNLSDDDRFMHLFLAKDARDYLQEFDYEPPEFLNAEELASGAIQIAQEAGLDAPSKSIDVESSNRALNQIVHAYWTRIKASLSEIDRTDLITACIANQERLLRDFDRWQRTSRAVLSLHKDASDVLKTSQALKAKRDRTQITHRIMIEMAVCTCPVAGGRPATQADIDYMGSQILLLIATAAHSDAIRTRCADPAMKIWRLGDFTLGDDFMDVMHPYLASHFEKSHMAEVERYADLFMARKEGTLTDTEVFGQEFVESFHGEFGISPGRLAELASILAEDAISQGKIVVVRETDSLSFMLAKAGFSQVEIDGIWKSFVLKPRDRWDLAEKPFRNKDWFPWRYRRRLSLMARPIVNLGDGRVIYAPGFCEDSFRHSVMECFQGAFETEYFDTQRMRQLVGAVNARRGLEFNRAVGDLFRAEGWSVRLEVKMKELNAPRKEAAGDVDVLAWKSSIVCVCECKELLFARTLSEVADQLARFRGVPGDDLDKHLRRSSFLNAHTQGIQKITRIDNPQIVPLFVTSKIVPMQFARTFATQVVSADQVTADFLSKLLQRNSSISSVGAQSRT